MIISSVMDEVGDQLDTIDSLRVFRYPTDQPPAPPAVVISYPETYEFDGGYGRGMDRMTLPVVALVGRVSDRASRDNLAVYVNGSGTGSFKQVLESGTYTTFDSVRVQDVDFDVYQVGGVDYLAGIFSLDIVGPGGS